MNKIYKLKTRLPDYIKEYFIWLVLLVNFITGIISLRLSPVGLDEPFSIFHAQTGIGEIISVMKGGNNPPLYEILLHFWIKVFGISPISVRFPSLLFSIGTIFFTYKIVKKVSSVQNAVFTILLLTFSNYFIYFTHEARAYSLFLLLTVILIYLIIKVSENGAKEIKDLVYLGFTAVLLIYTHYFGVFVLTFQSVFFILINRKQRTVLKKYLILCVVVLLLYSPYLSEIYHRFTDSSQNGTWVKATENLGNLHDMIFWFANKNRFVYALVLFFLYGSLWKLFYQLEIRKILKSLMRFFILPVYFLISLSIFFSLPFIWRLTEFDFVTFIFVAIPLIIFVFFSFYYGKKNAYKLLIIGSFLIPLLLFFAVSFYIPIWVDRYLVFILPFFYITLSTAVRFLFKGKYFYGSAIILLSMMFYSFNLATSDHNAVDKAVKYVKQNVSDESIIIINPKQYELTFLYHYDRDIFSDYYNFSKSLKKNGIYPIYGTPGVEEVEKQAVKHILYVDANSNFLYPNNGVYEKLKTDCKLIKVKTFNHGINVAEFSLSGK